MSGRKLFATTREITKSGQRAVQQFDAVPIAVGADQEADLIIRRRQRIADDLASEVQIA